MVNLLMTLLESSSLQGAQVAQHPDLAYVHGGHDRQKLDLYLPKNRKSGDKPVPVILWIHGGGWSQGSRKQCLPVREG